MTYKPWLATWPRFTREDTHNTLFGIDHEKVAVLDTETTGLHKIDQITEISIVDYHTRQILMNTLVRPKDLEESFNQTKASALTGITYDMLLDAPTFPEILPQLLPILKEYIIAAFNSSYDAKMIIRSAFAWGFTIPQFETLDIMTLFETFIGFSDWSTLSEALEILGIDEAEEAYRSLADVYSTIKVMQEMQKHVKEERIILK